MKTKLKLLGLTLMVLLTSLSTAWSTEGTCWLLCQDLNTGAFSDVQYPETYEGCCYGPSQCPSGTMTVSRAWADTWGFDFCRPI